MYYMDIIISTNEVHIGYVYLLHGYTYIN